MVRPRNFSRCYVKCIAVLLLALGMLFAACPAYCNDYYVSPTGSDTTGDGSIGNPWKTIPQAVSVVVPGDTIYLRGGTHGYTSTISITTNGTSENPITLRAYQDEAVIVDHWPAVWQQQQRNQLKRQLLAS